MTGYWRSADNSRVTLDEEGWVHTGDLGYLDPDGYLYLTGRSSDLIIRGGENIAPEEVEAVLHEHTAVAEAAVIGVPDDVWGERVEAVVVLQPDQSVTSDELLDFCRSRLAGSKRPERVHFVPELPRTSTGKLIRRQVAPLVA